VLKSASDSQFSATLSDEACAVADLDPIKDGSDTGRHHAPCVTIEFSGSRASPENCGLSPCLTATKQGAVLQSR
jgi:hypothetical protein